MSKQSDWHNPLLWFYLIWCLVLLGYYSHAIYCIHFGCFE